MVEAERELLAGGGDDRGAHSLARNSSARMSACVAPLRHGALKWTRTPVAPVRPWRSFTSYSDGDVRVDKLRHLYTAIVGRKGCG